MRRERERERERERAESEDGVIKYSLLSLETDFILHGW